MRASFALFSSLIVLVLACTDMPTLPERPGVVVPPEVVAVTTMPSRDDGRTPSIVRLVLELGHPFAADAARAGRIVLVMGGADPAEVSAIAHYHTTAALRARFAPLVAWGEPVEAPTRFFVQPTTPLPAGRATLVLLIDRKDPFVADLDVAAGALVAKRVWPLDGGEANALTGWIYCTNDDAALDAALATAPDTIAIAPAAGTARVVRRLEAPCVELVPEIALNSGIAVPPPNLGALSLWPASILVDDVAGEPHEAHCNADEVSLGWLCARVDDDRVVLVGGDTTPLLVMGRIGAQTIAVGVAPHARVTVRGLPPSTTLELALVVRAMSGESRSTGYLHTIAPHRHLVLNEVLSHPPSGSPLQRFVEVVNDGDRPASLGELRLADGDRFLALPPLLLSPGEFALITPTGYVDGLGGDASPNKSVVRVLVDALKLTTDLSLLDDVDRVLSRFPGSTSTRTVSRGRRTPDQPDDAPEAFGFDANDKATPGSPNAVW